MHKLYNNSVNNNVISNNISYLEKEENLVQSLHLVHLHQVYIYILCNYIDLYKVYSYKFGKIFQ